MVHSWMNMYKGEHIGKLFSLSTNYVYIAIWNNSLLLDIFRREGQARIFSCVIVIRANTDIAKCCSLSYKCHTFAQTILYNFFFYCLLPLIQQKNFLLRFLFIVFLPLIECCEILGYTSWKLSLHLHNIDLIFIFDVLMFNVQVYSKPLPRHLYIQCSEWE